MAGMNDAKTLSVKDRGSESSRLDPAPTMTNGFSPQVHDSQETSNQEIVVNAGDLEHRRSGDQMIAVTDESHVGRRFLKCRGGLESNAP